MTEKYKTGHARGSQTRFWSKTSVFTFRPVYRVTMTTSILPIRCTAEGYVYTSIENVYLKPVVVHGSIGAGKTTILASIERRGFRVLYEDLESWRNVNGHNLLEEYYCNPSRLAYVFQSEIIRTRYVQFMGLINDRSWLSSTGEDTMTFGKVRVKIIFTERDHLSSLRVFSKRLVDQGLMLPVEYSHLEIWANMLRLPVSRHIIYLSISASECMKRIEERSRPEEMKRAHMGTASGVDERLLDDIDAYYMQWLVESFPLQVTYIQPFRLNELETKTTQIIGSVKR